MNLKRWLVISPTLFFLFLPRLYAEEAKEQMVEQPGEVETVQRTVEGIHFQVPPDLPIEAKDGQVRPLPFELYLHRKIKALGSHLEALEKKIDRLEKRVSSIEKKGNDGH